MKGYSNSSLISTLRNERGSSAFTFAGYAIIVVVIIGAFWIFQSGDFGKPAQDQNYESGKKALENKHWTEAISFFDKSLKTNPDNVAAYLGKSKASLQLGNLDKALEEANKAIQMKPSAQAFGQKAIIEKVQGKTEEAMKDFSKAIDLDKNFAWAYAQRADMYSRMKDQEKALQDVNKAIQIKSDFVDAIRLRAWVHNRNGKCKEASADFMAAEKLSPKNAWTIQDRAWFLLTCPDEKLQDATKAMELAKEADKLTGGKDAVVQETLAEAFFRQHDALSAVKHQQQAIELDSKKHPEGSPRLKEMQERLQKYQMAARQETRTNYEVLSLDGGL